MELTRTQRAVLVILLAAIIAVGLIGTLARTRSAAMPDAVVLRPAPDQPAYILVQVSGAVARPGLYWLEEGSTVERAIMVAGGPRADADLSKLVLGQRVHHGDRIVVPAKPRPVQYRRPHGGASRPIAIAPQRAPKPRQQRSSYVSAGPVRRINVNTASPEELEALPGIGPTLARRIVQERSTRGPFKSIEDLQRVKGIGPAKAAKLAPYVEF